ncbi:MAG TPA: YeeE/YedE thiosulfate transporter family protein [Vicinamibacterales bacterium]|nr:YeeE/YedE thiosulfate transporter family protein [Vicinamibacterales bacterium]
MKYADPYVSGVALGLVLLAAFVFAGRGLGASGAFGATATGAVAVVAPAYAEGNPYFGRYLSRPGGPWREWLLFEIAGVIVGAFASAALSGRLRRGVERGRGVTIRARITSAFAGGSLMGIGAVLARGCTSGQALTGGALLSVGSWTFILSAFAAGHAVAPALKRAWQ